MKKRYVVTKGADDGTLQKGDHIFFYEDGSIGCVEAQGWLDKEWLESNNEFLKSIEYTLDIEWINKYREELKSELKELKEMIEER